VVLVSVISINDAFASNHPTIEIITPKDISTPPQFWNTYYYDICAGSTPLKNPTIHVITDLDGLMKDTVHVDLEPYACTFSSLYLRVKDPNSLKVGFPEISQLTVKLESITSSGDPDRYNYFLLMCNGDERVTTDVTFTTDMETSTIEYDSGTPLATCASYEITLNAKDKDSFVVKASPSKLKEKPLSYKEPTIKLPSTLVNELGIRYNFSYSICLGEKKLDTSVIFTTDVDTQEVVDSTHGEFASPYSCVYGATISMKAKDPKSITAKFTNMETQREFEKWRIQTDIEQEQILLKQKMPLLLQELLKQYEGRFDVTVTSFNNIYQTWDGKLPSSVGSSELPGMCCFSVIWLNDDKLGNTITSTKGLFDSGSIELGKTYTYKFDTPGLYPYYSKLYPEIKHAVRVYNPATECTPGGGCGNPTLIPDTWCKSFGIMEGEKCLNEKELNKAIQEEVQRRTKVFDDRKNQSELKIIEIQDLKKELEKYNKPLLDLDKMRYDIDESEYIERYNKIVYVTEPLEQKINDLSTEVNELQQTNRVNFVCVKYSELLFTCITEIKSSNELEPESSTPTKSQSITKKINNETFDEIENLPKNKEIQIMMDFKNEKDEQQPFAYILQISDENGVVVSLSWVSGSLGPGQILDQTISWIPEELGKYTAETFLWQDFDNATPLSESDSIMIDVSK
jgi:hypothetical protein